jgi:hypothetical protein
VFWSGRRAAGHASEAIGDAASSVADVVTSAYHSLPGVS